MTRPVPTGKLYTSNPAGLKFLKEEAELWQIMRAGHELSGAIRVKELSPSDQLFHTYIREWKGLPSEKWWPYYEEQFMREMKTDEKLQGLRAIYKKLLLGHTIVLICFCDDHRICHRRLVGGFFKQYGVEAVELNPVTTEQISLF
ncbi:DUF488 domain-containing protein [Lederbergia sp. NSJ-179]|uniref:DUF488 family protein, N3 subclade n=1 Tax=Lederbergia sp. NSJ-179 TaxID=2931402 RepID=UPI001FD0B885|nr:DUF488 family protein [Lederbergia sp. NSJ-179]MCJ7843287.1 DUF488 domain-containing protein [Lederbergia sp. NSJ-179]